MADAGCTQPASVSMAFAIFSMSMSRHLFDFGGRHVAAF
jgi:hypothetical protein